MERLARVKHSSFLRKSVNYVRIKFYDTGPRCAFRANVIRANVVKTNLAAPIQVAVFLFSVLRRHGGSLESVGRRRSPPGRREGPKPVRRLPVAQAIVVHHEVRQLFIVDDVENLQL